MLASSQQLVSHQEKALHYPLAISTACWEAHHMLPHGLFLSYSEDLLHTDRLRTLCPI